MKWETKNVLKISSNVTKSIEYISHQTMSITNGLNKSFICLLFLFLYIINVRKINTWNTGMVSTLKAIKYTIKASSVETVIWMRSCFFHKIFRWISAMSANLRWLEIRSNLTFINKHLHMNILTAHCLHYGVSCPLLSSNCCPEARVVLSDWICFDTLQPNCQIISL